MRTLRLFVGGMKTETMEEELAGFFVGMKVLDIRIVRDKENNNRSKGFGFVTLETSRNLKSIVDEFHLGQLGGRQVTVNEARPRGERPAQKREEKRNERRLPRS